MHTVIRTIITSFTVLALSALPITQVFAQVLSDELWQAEAQCNNCAEEEPPIDTADRMADYLLDLNQRVDRWIADIRLQQAIIYEQKPTERKQGYDAIRTVLEEVHRTAHPAPLFMEQWNAFKEEHKNDADVKRNLHNLEQEVFDSATHVPTRIHVLKGYTPTALQHLQNQTFVTFEWQEEQEELAKKLATHELDPKRNTYAEIVADVCNALGVVPQIDHTKERTITFRSAEEKETVVVDRSKTVLAIRSPHTGKPKTLTLFVDPRFAFVSGIEADKEDPDTAATMTTMMQPSWKNRLYLDTVPQKGERVPVGKLLHTVKTQEVLTEGGKYTVKVDFARAKEIRTFRLPIGEKPTSVHINTFEVIAQKTGNPGQEIMLSFAYAPGATQEKSRRLFWSEMEVLTSFRYQFINGLMTESATVTSMVDWYLPNSTVFAATARGPNHLQNIDAVEFKAYTHIMPHQETNSTYTLYFDLPKE